MDITVSKCCGISGAFSGWLTAQRPDGTWELVVWAQSAPAGVQPCPHCKKKIAMGQDVTTIGIHGGISYCFKCGVPLEEGPKVKIDHFPVPLQNHFRQTWDLPEVDKVAPRLVVPAFLDEITEGKDA